MSTRILSTSPLSASLTVPIPGHPGASTGRLTLAALGVVFGDIGTSPVYTLRTCFAPEYGLPATTENILGICSLIIWAVLFIVVLKYIAIVMRADNGGEGGILALLSLDLRSRIAKGWKPVLVMLGLVGASLFYGDSMITPAISVLSAVEGLGIASPSLKPFVLPITIAVLVALFLAQSRGTEKVGAAFGPIMVLWFAVLALLGVLQIIGAPQVLAAFDPRHAFWLLAGHGTAGVAILGAVALAITGAEALYADMGHFGRRPITAAAIVLVIPSLVINYLGQGALLMQDPSALENPFFRSAPDWALYPLVLLASAATVIASQAVISGAFSLSQQAIQLELMPRLDVVQTSEHERGQIYVSQINWILMVAVLLLVVSFGSSDALASAYGLAVTGTMTITTALLFIAMRHCWKWSLGTSLAVALPLAVVDVGFFAANMTKLESGGWFPLAIGTVVFLLMSTWHRGRALLAHAIERDLEPISRLPDLARLLPRVPGTAVFMTAWDDRLPLPLVQNMRHNHVLHERVVLLQLKTDPGPRVDQERRVQVRELGANVWYVAVSFGFAEHPDLAQALTCCAMTGIDIDLDTASFFTGRSNIDPRGRMMSQWRGRLFEALLRVQTRATDYFRLPSRNTVEMGSEVGF